MDDPRITTDEGEPRNDDEMAEATGLEATEAGEDGQEATGLEGIEPETPQRTAFLDYLRSPIVTINVGTGDEATALFAHQALLIQSPYFAQAVSRFKDSSPRVIDLQNDDILATSSVLEWIYKGDYFPTMDAQKSSLEYDPSVPAPDDQGVGLLRHARVYTLAQRFGLPELAGLAHRKIHLTSSTAKGEIAYARFVYKETTPEDLQIRRPVAAFWATRSHVLRHEAEHEFERMCLEFPQFGFDVLSLVLDAQEKRSQRTEVQSSGGAGRKRQRVSGIVP